MQSNSLQSSIVTCDYKMPLLFRDKNNDNIENIQPFNQAQSLLLDALEGLITVNIINTLINN